jgi:AraC-like DNA-binding protein
MSRLTAGPSFPGPDSLTDATSRPPRRDTGAVDREPASTYHELPPPPALADYVECLWVHRIGDIDGSYAQPVLPDGCVDIVALGEEVLLAGPATRSTTLHLGAGALTVGVRFRTGAAPALVGVSAAELRDRDVHVDDVWGRAGSQVTERIVGSADWQGRLDVMVAAMTERLDSAAATDRVAVGIAGLLANDAGRPVTELADHVGLSERQLRRRVEQAVGYSPRTLARILRFQRFLHFARTARPPRGLAVLAADAGYADQAHLTRDSRDLSGLPPAALLDWETARTG